MSKGRIMDISPDLYLQRLHNEWFMNLYNQGVARDEKVRDAEIDLMNAQAEYFRELAKQLKAK